MCWQMAIRAVRVQVTVFVQLRSRLRDHVERIAGSRVQKKYHANLIYSATALPRYSASLVIVATHSDPVTFKVASVTSDQCVRT